MKVLVTGAAGFIGSAITAELVHRGYQVEAVDGFLDGLYPRSEKLRRAENLYKNFGISVSDQDLNDNFQLNSGIDAIVHAAAMPGLSFSWSNPESYVICNELATLNLLSEINRVKTPRLVFVSTSSVYGKMATGAEESPTLPVSPYGSTKLAAEKLISLLISPTTSYSIARLFSVYGPGQRSDMAYNKFISAALGGDEIMLFGDGNQSRSNTFIDDAVDGLIRTLEQGANAETYNIGGGEEVRLKDSISQIFALAGKSPKIVQKERVMGDQERTKANFQKAKKELGFSPQTSFIDGIEQQFEWQRSISL